MEAQRQPRNNNNSDPVAEQPPSPSMLGDNGSILRLGLFRTGTYSITKAHNILGYLRVLYGKGTRDSLYNKAGVQPWAQNTKPKQKSSFFLTLVNLILMSRILRENATLAGCYYGPEVYC